jgi:hypothetical protein
MKGYPTTTDCRFIISIIGGKGKRIYWFISGTATFGRFGPYKQHANQNADKEIAAPTQSLENERGWPY